MDLHIRVTFLVDRFGRTAMRWFDLFTSLLAIIFCVVLLWQTTIMTWVAFKENWTTPTVLSVPYALIYVSMVIGSALLLATLGLRTILQVISPKTAAYKP